MKGEKTTLNLNLTMADGTLFDIEEFTDPTVCRIMAGHTCRECGHRVVKCYRETSYCNAHGSRRTQNGMLKVKANQPACILFTNKNNSL